MLRHGADSTYIDALIQPLGDSGSELLDGEDDHRTEREAVVEFVLHDVDFLRAQICDQASAKDVGSGDTGLGIEDGEPKMSNTRRRQSAARVVVVALKVRKLCPKDSPFIWNESHSDLFGQLTSHGPLGM